MPSTPPSPSSEQRKFDEELKEAHELNALLALHLTQQNLDQQTSSINPSPSPNLVHFENHIQNCICCNYLQQQNHIINEHLTWIEYLLTRATPTSSSTTSIPNSSLPNTPYPSPSNHQAYHHASIPKNKFTQNILFPMQDQESLKWQLSFIF